jgi:hypothetical protein
MGMGEGVLTKLLDLDRDPVELDTNSLELDPGGI